MGHSICHKNIWKKLFMQNDISKIDTMNKSGQAYLFPVQN